MLSPYNAESPSSTCGSKNSKLKAKPRVFFFHFYSFTLKTASPVKIAKLLHFRRENLEAAKKAGIFSRVFNLPHIILRIALQRLGRQNRHMGLWSLVFKSYGPFLKSMGHGSYGMGQKLKKINIGILVRDVTFDNVYHTASCS